VKREERNKKGAAVNKASKQEISRNNNTLSQPSHKNHARILLATYCKKRMVNSYTRKLRGSFLLKKFFFKEKVCFIFAHLSVPLMFGGFLPLGSEIKVFD
jgi:hypothetical protein